MANDDDDACGRRYQEMKELIGRRSLVMLMKAINSERLDSTASING